MTAPLVSVIIPVYNGARFLAESIASVLAQTYRPLEVIVVDDGSTDESARVAQDFPVHYCLQPHGGPGAARNYGVTQARGELLAFQDADDLWTADKLSMQVDYLLAHPAVQYTITRGRFFLEPGCTGTPPLSSAFLSRDYRLPLFQTLVIRRQAFERVGWIDTQLPTSEDVDWFARAADLGLPMAAIELVLFHKRIHDANISAYSQENMRNLFTALRRSAQRKRA